MQIREGDAASLAVLRTAHHEGTWLAVRAERELQRLLGGDCTLPVGARTTLGDKSIALSAILFRESETAPRLADATGPIPEAVAQAVHNKLISL